MENFILPVITTVIGVTITFILKSIFKKFKWNWIFYIIIIVLTFAYYNNSHYQVATYFIFVYLFFINLASSHIKGEDGIPYKFIICILIPSILFFIKKFDFFSINHINDIVHYCGKPLNPTCINYLASYKNLSYYILFHINNFLFVVFSLKLVDAITSYNRNFNKFLEHEKYLFILFITSSNSLFLILKFVFFTINYVTK